MNLPDHALPDSMQELADYIGLPATLKLVELRGGVSISVPKKARDTHWLVPHIGMEALQSLVEIYQGETIEIPRCAGALRALKEQAILNDAKTLSNTALAQRYTYTVRGIRKLLRRVEAQQNDDQGDFFT